MTRGGVCLSCHQEIPEESLAVSMLHHVADATGLTPKTNEQHDQLVNKSILMVAWFQVIGGAVAGIIGMLIFFRILRARRRKKAAA